MGGGDAGGAGRVRWAEGVKGVKMMSEDTCLMCFRVQLFDVRGPACMPAYPSCYACLPASCMHASILLYTPYPFKLPFTPCYGVNGI